jgi:DNA replication ATP-dependent helicase Dna2
MSPANALYQEIIRTAALPDPDVRAQVMALSALLERLFVEATRREQLMFSTLFARICYVGHQRQMSQETLRVIHTFRRVAAKVRNGREAQPRDVRLGIKATAEAVLVLYETALPTELLQYLPTDAEWAFQSPEIWDYKAVARVVALRDLPEQRAFAAVDEDDPTGEVKVLYDLPDRNENFRPTIELIRKLFKFPVTLHLLETDIDRDGHYRPRAFVVEPDYLMDVTAIAECFKDDGVEPLSYLLRKFLPQETTPALHIGNVANFFLDRLLTEPQARFPDLFKETFRLTPFVYAPMSDQEVKDINQRAQKHFVTLQQMANGGLEKQQIDPAHCVLEPSFFSQQYGIQGRLDLFYQHEERSAIVELKSGVPFKPNSYGIARSHFTQTLLYDLLVRSVYGRQTDPAKYILYSAMPEQPLRFAPTVESEQWEALQVRNQLVGLEKLLTEIRPGQEEVPVLRRLSSARMRGKGFLERDAVQFESRYNSMSPLERKYFNAFVGMVAREQWLAKLGEHEVESSWGHAALWRNSFAEKQANYSILNHLEIVDNCADQPEPFLLFRRTERTATLANFRQGDIAVLYPAFDDNSTVLDYQVIRCTVTELNRDTIKVQLRYRQFNLQAFEVEAHWHIEPDLMEMGFTAMHRSLFNGRFKVLPPELPPFELPEPTTISPGLTEEQSHLLEKMLHTPQYFLLWGPPGTGKTSVMLRELSRRILTDTTDNLLLLAFTNRAVDEICEALDHIGGDIRAQYLRIGSWHSSGAEYRTQLLSHKIGDTQTRAELKAVLEQHRIVVSTVAAFSSNENLLKIKQFQRLVVDEASQLLEPQLIGLLPLFRQYILIGDHRQLPAVTTQRPEWTQVDDPDLQAIGLTDLRDSYFERLYRRCLAEGNTRHLGRLSAQGRMQAPLMDFPNEHFYDGMLRLLHEGQAATDAEVPQVRFVGIRPNANTIGNPKVSEAEAQEIARQVQFFQQLWVQRGLPWEPKTLGIITPWRAQIAQIRDSLEQLHIAPDICTIDTVERYQGGARDIILISCCVHNPYQLDSLVSRSNEGIDRKLNVALTRARQYLVMVGHPDVLKTDGFYGVFMGRYG